MKPQFNSSSVRNEVATMQIESVQASTKRISKLGWELPASILALGIIFGAVFVLSHYGLICNV